jgi:hypothetical protein
VAVDIVASHRLDVRLLGLALGPPDGLGQASLLLGEQVGPDLVVVYTSSSLRRCPSDRRPLDGSGGGVPSAGLGGRRPGLLELLADGRLQLLAVTDQPQAE